MEIGLNTMNFETAKRIFEHTLDCESRVSTAINLGLLKLINMELIESTSQLVGETISSGNRVWMTSDLHFLPKPFGLKQLAAKVKEVLSGAAPH